MNKQLNGFEHNYNIVTLFRINLYGVKEGRASSNNIRVIPDLTISKLTGAGPGPGQI